MKKPIIRSILMTFAVSLFIIVWVNRMLSVARQAYAANQPQLDATSQVQTTKAQSVSWQHKTASQLNTILIVGVSLTSGQQNTADRTVASITYNGIHLTKFTSFAYWFSEGEIWYLTNPPSGNHTITVTINGYTGGISAGAETYYNSNLAIPFSSLTTNTGYAGTPSVTIPTTTSQTAIDMIFTVNDEQDAVFTPASGQTQLWTSTSKTQGPVAHSSYQPGYAGSTPFSWSWTSKQIKPHWAEMGIALNSAPASIYSISGYIFNDVKGNGVYAAPPDTLYTGGGNITLTGPTNTTTIVTNGSYTAQNLLPGTYTVSYNGPPAGYYISYPRNGTPPSFQVTVGQGSACSVNGNNNATCLTGNIINLDYGITNATSWIQSVCGDIRQDVGIQNTIPASPTCGQYSGAYMLQTDGNVCTTPGIAFSGSTNANFGQGQASTNAYNWTVGSANNPEQFKTPASNIIHTSYKYMIAKASQAGIIPSNLSQQCNLNSCVLSNAAGGLYQTNSSTPTDLHVQASNFSGNRNYVFLVSGNLYIDGPITIAQGSTATFSVAGNIYVNANIGNINPDDMTSDIDGFYSADQSFIINAAPGTCADKKLVIAGSVTTNAGLNGGSFQNNRTLCSANAECAAVSVTERPDLILNTPAFLKYANHIWQEVAP